MDSSLLILSVILIIGFGIVIYLISKKNSSSDSTLLEWLKSMDKRLDNNSQQLNSRLDKAAEVIAGVQKT